MRTDLTERLESMSEDSYRIFSERIIKTGKPVLGVRMGPIRAMAKELVRDPDWNYADLGPIERDWYYEERLLRALTIAYQKCDEEHRISLLEEFLPYLDNWAICDSLCSTLKQARRETELYLSLILRHLHDDHPYQARFAIVLLLNHYMYESRIEENLRLLETISTHDYYVKMAVAWAISTASKVSSELVGSWMHTSLADADIRAMAAQKIRDSRRARG